MITNVIHTILAPTFSTDHKMDCVVFALLNGGLNFQLLVYLQKKSSWLSNGLELVFLYARDWALWLGDHGICRFWCAR
jgi:hypothetical protein